MKKLVTISVPVLMVVAEFVVVGKPDFVHIVLEVEWLLLDGVPIVEQRQFVGSSPESAPEVEMCISS